MAATFVWFHNHNEKPNDSATFYNELLDWTPAAGPGRAARAVRGSACGARERRAPRRNAHEARQIRLRIHRLEGRDP
jgi:hypothetical protein